MSEPTTTSDWQALTIPEFDELANLHQPTIGVSLGIFDRLPYGFGSKHSFVEWRDSLAEGFGIDGKDIILVGSAATGRSLSARKKFHTFHPKSDIDIAAVSHHHFDIAWRWFRRTNPAFLTGMDDTKKDQFAAHRKHYVFEGVIAADYFLSYLPFGSEWQVAMQRTQNLLPETLQGRLLKVRLYRDFASLRDAQVDAMATYKRYLANKLENKESASA